MWSEVAEFGVLHLPVRGGTVMQVGIRLKTPRSQLVRELTSGTAAHFDAVLPETYRMTVERLCALLDEWRTAESLHR